jgi:glutamyl/glutaminyl-tRNA synthetase
LLFLYCVVVSSNMSHTPHAVVTRIAPSPTGFFHIGTARTALFNYLFARHNGGKFLVRIEDTDKERSKKEYEDTILHGMELLGLEYDALYRQSEHLERHVALLQKLVDENKAYISREPMKDDPSKEVDVVRLRNPGKTVTFHDEVRGDITFDTTELGDMVIARSMRDPLYHFAVVVDDADEGVTHVIRGEEHISNTPRQILLQEALGFAQPAYVHLPLILAPDRSKMSKRKEIFTLAELVKVFTLEGVQKGGAVFNKERLEWVHKEHRARKDTREVQKEVVEALSDTNIGSVVEKSAAAVHDLLERYPTMGAMKRAVEVGEYDFYVETPTVDAKMVLPKKGATAEETRARLEAVAELFSGVDEKNWHVESIKNAAWDYAEQEGKGLVLWPLRVALSGKERSPDPFTIAEAVRKEETLRRVAAACEVLV